MNLKLHDNFFIELGKHTETKWKTIQNDYGHRELEKYEEKKFYPIAIYTKSGNLVCYASEINEFLELLGAFISNQLNPQKVYGFSYQNGGGFLGKVVKRKDNVCIAIKVDEKENFILEKYDCRVIMANAKQILSKCTLEEFI